MKRSLSLIILILLSITLIGCSNTTDNSTKESSEEVEEPVANVSGGDQLAGTWETEYNDSTVVLAINDDGTYEFYQKKNNFKVLVPGSYTDKNDTLTLTPGESKRHGEGEFDFNGTTTIPYTLDGNELHTSINNQQITFRRL